jgi:enoyl-CoA hydratase/carnithine racemase
MMQSFSAPDFAEGVASFLERREPSFAAVVG